MPAAILQCGEAGIPVAFNNTDLSAPPVHTHGTAHATIDRKRRQQMTGTGCTHKFTFKTKQL